MLNKTIYSTIFPHLQNLPPVGTLNAANDPNDPGKKGPVEETQQPGQNQQPAPAPPSQVQQATQGAQQFLQQQQPTEPQIDYSGQSRGSEAAPPAVAQPTPDDIRHSQATTDFKKPLPGLSPKNGRTPYGPEVDPNASPEEQARTAVEFWEEQRRNPTNQDKGWKGLTKELIQNFLFSMGHTQPGMGVAGALTLGAAGAGAGFLNKGWNEQRQADTELPRARQNLQFETQQSQRHAQIANDQNQILNRNARTRIDMNEEVRKQLSAEQDNLLKVWEKTPNATRETHPRLFEAAEKAGVMLADKKEGGRFTTQIAPDGRVVVSNTVTGEYQVGNENLSKPGQFDEKLLTDEMLGLSSDKDIENMAAAGITQNTPGVQYRPEVVDALPPEARNPDGSFNMEAFSRMKAKEDPRVAAITLDKIMSNAPDDYKQRTAAEVERIRGGEKETRAEVAKLRAALGSHRPGPNAKAKPLTTVTETFKRILTMPAKEREAALSDFYNKYLPNVRVE